jgi:hypothetical protein
MSRQVITKAVTIPATDYAHPARTLKVGDVVELTAAEITAITTAGGTVRATAFRDSTGEHVGVTNSN